MAWYDDPLGSLSEGFQDYIIDPLRSLGIREEEEEEDPFEGMEFDEFGNEIRAQMPDGSPAFPGNVDDAGLPMSPIPQQPAPQQPAPQQPIPQQPRGPQPLFNPGDQQGVNNQRNRENNPLWQPPEAKPDKEAWGEKYDRAQDRFGYGSDFREGLRMRKSAHKKGLQRRQFRTEDPLKSKNLNRDWALKARKGQWEPLRDHRFQI